MPEIGEMLREARMRRRIDMTYPVHTPQAQQQLVAAGVGRGAADHAAVTALWNQCDLCIRAQPDDRRHLFG